MLVTVQKLITETISLQLPAYFKDTHWHYCINKDESVLQVSRAQITAWTAGTSASIDAANAAAKGDQITADDFEKAYNEAQAVITMSFESNLLPR